MTAVSLKEEEEAFNAVRAALRDAHHVFTKGVAPVAAADAVPLTPEQCIQLLDVYLRLILETSDDAAAYVLSRSFQTEFFDVLVRYVFQPMVFNPSATSGYVAQQSFLDLRSAAAKALNHVLLRATSLGAEGVASSCFRSALDTELMMQLVASLGNAAIPEVIRCSLTEAVFIFMLRFGVEGQSLFVQHQGVAAVTNALVLDSSTVVRNYCGSILRELAESFAAEVAAPNTISVCIKVMTTDSSVDVRILVSEVLTLCLRNCVDTRYVLLQPHQLLQATEEQLMVGEALDAAVALSSTVRQPLSSTAAAASPREQDVCIVKDAVCRLLQTCCLVAANACIEEFFEVAYHMRLAQKLCRLVGGPTAGSPRRSATSSHTKLKASIATTIRFFLQYSPHRLQVSDTIVAEFASLASLLKAVIDAGKLLGHGANGVTPSSPPRTAATSAASPTSEAFDAYCVELAVAVSLMAAQGPSCRHYLQRELMTVPMWATTLKASLLGCLNKASLDFFGSLDMTDVTGVHLNALDGIEWSEAHKPRRHSILSVFEKQEARVASGAIQPSVVAPLPTPTSDVDWQRRCRLTFVLLNFAVHLALSPPEGSGPAADGAIPADAAVQTPRTRRSDTSAHASISRRASPVPNRADNFATPGTPRGRGLMGSTQRAASATTTASRGPLFPNVSGGAGGADASFNNSRSALTQQEREALAVAFDKFNSSFQLTLQLAECYAKKARDEAMYVTTNDGFVVRADKLKNPWGPVVQKPSLRSWTVKDVNDGDLFYFAIPFDDLNERSIGIVEERAKRHITRLKKTMVTVSQQAKGRRWFLYDCVNFVLPRCLGILTELRRLCNDHGDANLRFPVFLFREKEMHLGERCLHPGNVIEVVDQVKYYFSQRPTDLVGSSDETIATLKKKMDSLRGRKFQGDEVISPIGSDDDDDDGHFRGHGAISSESEGDDV